MTTRRTSLVTLIIVLLAGAAALVATHPWSTTVAQQPRSGVLGLQGGASSGGSTVTTTGSPTAAAPGAASPTSSGVAPSVSPTAAPTGGGSNPTPNPTSSAPVGPPSCGGQPRIDFLQVSSGSYSPGQVAQATTSMTNHGSDCVLGDGSLTYRITDTSDNASMLPGGSARVTVLAANSVVGAGSTVTSTAVHWDLQDCSQGSCVAAKPGSYTITVTWAGLPALTSQPFTVTAAAACPNNDFQAGISLSTSYPSGSHVVITGTVQNVSAQTCSTSDQVHMVINDAAGHTVYASGLGSATTARTWGPHQPPVQFPFEWNNGSQTIKGHYTVTFFDDAHGITVPTQGFDIT